MRPSFNYIDGLKVQKFNLIEWEKKLNNECYKALEFYTSEHNKSLLNHIEFLGTDDNMQGYLVKRGGSLAEFVQKYQPKL